jgi:hypothetical protein
VAPELKYELYYRRYEKPNRFRKEPVVLAQTLAHPVNADMTLRQGALIDTINGIRIDSMKDVAQAFENQTNLFHIIRFAPHHQMECLDRIKADEAHPEILKTYRISKDRQ